MYLEEDLNSLVTQASCSGAFKGHKFVLVMMALSVIGMVNLNEQVACLQQQQQQRQSQEEQGYPSQSLFVDGSDGHDLAMIGDGEILGQREQQLVADFYRSNKRAARKMSSFMPMRGRKDGRDELEGSGSELAYFSELADSEPSILRLVSASSQRQATNQGQMNPSIVGAGRLLHWSNPNHSQINKHLNGLEQTSSPGALALTQQRVAGSSASVDNLEGQFMEQPVMQAKLRRAFHPMRGKKSWTPPELTMLAPELSDSDSVGLVLSQ